MLSKLRARYLVGVLVAIGAGSAPGQEPKPAKKIETSMVVLTPTEIASVAIFGDKVREDSPLILWVKPIIAQVQARFNQEKARRTIVVQVTLHPDRAADVVVAGRPGLSEEERQTVLKIADPMGAPRSRIVDCVFRIETRTFGGDPDPLKPLVPALPTPFEERLAAIQAAPTPEKLAMLRRWAIREALPISAAIAATADPKFQGVRKFSETLRTLPTEEPLDIVALVDKNPDYWRATLEMGPGIPMSVVILASMHVANGEIDPARRLVYTLAPFDRHRSGYSALLSEFQAMSQLFYADVEGRIQTGIKLHDAGKYEAAIATFEGVLKDYPRSAWAAFERFQSAQMLALRDKTPAPDWEAARRQIIQANPLYGSMAVATSPDELYDLLLRKETESLFKDQAKAIPDLLRFAEIAVDLDQPQFAALINWNVLTNLQPAKYKNRDLLEDFLYCLEKLGVTSLKDNFQGDHATAFRRIDADRKKRRDEAPINKFKQK